MGAQIDFGNPFHGANVKLFGGPGHDRYSGLGTRGMDFMGYAHQVFGKFTLSAYRYLGSRPDVGSSIDRLTRQGFGRQLLSGALE